MRQHWDVSVYSRSLVLLTKAVIEGLLSDIYKNASYVFYLMKRSLQGLGIWHTSPDFYGHCLVTEPRFPNVCTTAIGEAIVTVFHYNTLLEVLDPRLVEPKNVRESPITNHNKCSTHYIQLHS